MTETVTMADLLERAKTVDTRGLDLGRLWPASAPPAPDIVTLGVWLWAAALGDSRATPATLTYLRGLGLIQYQTDVLCQALITATIDEHLGIDGAPIRAYLAGGDDILAPTERQAVLAVMTTLIDRCGKM